MSKSHLKMLLDELYCVDKHSPGHYRATFPGSTRAKQLKEEIMALYLQEHPRQIPGQRAGCIYDIDIIEDDTVDEIRMPGKILHLFTHMLGPFGYKRSDKEMRRKKLQGEIIEFYRNTKLVGMPHEDVREFIRRIEQIMEG